MNDINITKGLALGNINQNYYNKKLICNKLCIILNIPNG